MSRVVLVAIDVLPATPERWDDVVAVMGTKGDPSRCWCQYFRLRGQAWSSSSTASNRSALRKQVTAGDLPPGVIAYADETPAGWCAIAPRAGYPRVEASPNWRTDLRTDGLWSVTCFVVRPGRRRNGLTDHLLHGALELAADHGATAVEGCAVDTTERHPSADLYRGPLPTFLAAGFTEIARHGPAWIQVRKELRRP